MTDATSGIMASSSGALKARWPSSSSYPRHGCVQVPEKFIRNKGHDFSPETQSFVGLVDDEGAASFSHAGGDRLPVQGHERPEVYDLHIDPLVGEHLGRLSASG